MLDRATVFGKQQDSSGKSRPGPLLNQGGGILSKMPDDEILISASRHLETALSDRAHCDLPELGRRWSIFAAWIRGSISSFRNSIEAIHFAQQEVGFEPMLSTEKLTSLSPTLKNDIRHDFPIYERFIEGFYESTHLLPSSVAKEGDKLVSFALFQNIITIFDVLSLSDPAPRSILEVGGGYGGPARAWMLNPISKPQRYVILDLPESLFFAEVFLRKEFGSQAVHYVRRGENLNDMLSDIQPKIILCPLTCHRELLPLAFDIVINTRSMGEMSQDWIDFYCKYLEALVTKYFYSCNTFGRPIDNLAQDTNLFSPKLTKDWLLRHTACAREVYGKNYIRTLYEKCKINEINTGKYNEELEGILRRPFDVLSFLKMIDYFRLLQDENCALAIIKYCTERLDYFPKELIYLLEWLKLYGSSNFCRRHKSEVDTLFAKLREARASGTEAQVSPALEARIADSRFKLS